MDWYSKTASYYIGLCLGPSRNSIKKRFVKRIKIEVTQSTKIEFWTWNTEVQVWDLSSMINGKFAYNPEQKFLLVSSK